MTKVYYVEYIEGTANSHFTLLSENIYTSKEEAIKEAVARGYTREGDKNHFTPIVEGYDGWASIIEMNLLDKYDKSRDNALASLDEDLV